MTFVKDKYTPSRAEIGFTSMSLREEEEDDDQVFSDFTASELASFDEEGRCVITDHGKFVLLNVYFPNDPSEERLQYKMRFHMAIECRIHDFIKHGRQVILAGDVSLQHLRVIEF